MDKTEDTKALTNSQNEQEENPRKLWNKVSEEQIQHLHWRINFCT